MSFRWRDYQRLAEQLANGTGDASIQEAKLRSAISRAYYAAFKTAFSYLRDTRHDRLLEGKPGSEVGNTHQYVREELARSAGMDCKKVATCLQTLHVDRKRADYDDDFQGLGKKVAFCLGQAKSAIDLLEQLESS